MGQNKKIRLPQSCIHIHSSVTYFCPFLRDCCWGGSATAMSGLYPQFFPLQTFIPVLGAMQHNIQCTAIAFTSSPYPSKKSHLSSSPPPGKVQRESWVETSASDPAAQFNLYHSLGFTELPLFCHALNLDIFKQHTDTHSPIPKAQHQTSFVRVTYI